ncbi:Peptide methionine sulfoxide reductase [Ophidiomyces ophidiicola]|uniref:Peptide methionine sulfoxide reductase n=1 Tax=Ophidiomyces ophidiicola TaxID=1387563 RepID=A0ACB8UU47_9EURO|nr:Peptide methionine sulfoxide reductase [Ophidiomyces ophidiicola]KAI1907665.1 Peptide methionine sulfoxide reductase [Ophidiomyces ophidiicola]KAI1910888.1 Peptide methionine sulfoxide reductase [Ophidiomyces ophidiicola]KAI1925300.1 Peptide methionine sulfoxide reductase [Ophidiomyces ophidiicola]KAI1937444.1 Peptide methionine sulfoxide reductase [Ophidiomyces ophidiicola]KAI1951821.1 Peptide methionine sulfoxide reductase [Ophidiomyces ophidiicola]
MPLLSRLLRPFSSSNASLAIGPSESLAAQNYPAHAQRATIAAGCFWGVEHLFRKQFGNGKGLLDARVGYCGGNASSPTYRLVCTGGTGHAESLQVVFDPSLVSYGQLIEFFYRMHDPTTLNRQGGDVGTQYRSAIFTHNDEQQSIAESITEQVNKQWWKNKVETVVTPADQWWDAEDYHQLYLDKNPNGYECPAHFIRSFPPLT